ncbi:aldo/keto reductase [Pontivivens nitratireducens]|uniref:Aldo/keto reductase n=1 Tax=Pontivivens nitratireducens TaxID=2758038 RepID=A0A6G7VMB6_9RHOB|nr:aldo/keto reductase [Pontibrevibacter nitratireducens]QIK40937.1 aldo/keto reductase [Pontibrevibacter nitratireducens]
MKRNRLGTSDLDVSEICLGSMTWGSQNDEAQGHAQIDRALERGVNFIDTAEMYPTTPVKAETCGQTERIIGSWLKKTERRDEVIVATKIVGAGFAHLRDGAPITPASLTDAIEGSRSRLNVDTIDLYQTHWPNRGHFHFRKQWAYDPSDQDRQDVDDDLRRMLEALSEQVEQGRIRWIGVSNDTTWGIARMLQIAREEGFPRVVSVQNEYSLMYRHHDLDMAELSHHEQVGLLAYSPVACGLLSGKYSGDVIPKGSRRDVSAEGLGGRMNDHTLDAADDYVALARSHDLDPVQMALAFCISRPFMASTIIGATSLAQLDIALDAVNLTLSDAVLDGIAALHRKWPVPY